MAIDKILGNGDLDRVADSVFSAVNDSVSEIKAMQKRKAAENVQIVVQALKKIESDLKDKYDGVTTVIEKRVASIKDGQDGRNGADGRNGKDGRPGRDGLPGLKGNDGLSGRDGVDGVDGVSVTEAHIDFDGSLIISLSNGREINVGEVVAPDLAERIKVITNGGGTSQGVLDTLVSLQNQINALVNLGAVIYEGTWNASTNTPTIVSGVGDKGEYYVVSVAGNTSIDGETLWGVGDWIIFNGVAWQKVDGGSTGDLTSLTVRDNTTLGSSNTDNVTFNARIASEFTPATDNAFDLGSSGREWRDLFIDGTANIDSLVADTADINGGTIDGTTIGGATAAAGSFTNLSASGTLGVTGVATLGNGAILGTPASGVVTNLTGTASININGTVGATTASTGAFTTLAASGAVTLDGGTANGVAFLNASKVLTTGSALTFDGSNLETTGYASGVGLRAVSGGGVRFNNATNGNFSAINAPAGTGDMQFETGAGEQMRLTSTGLGIGTSSPATKLGVAGNAIISGATPFISLAYDQGGATPNYWQLGADGVATLFNNGTGVNGQWSFVGGGGSEFMRITAAGNVGIGTSSPGSKLSVQGDGTTFRLDGTGNTSRGILLRSTGTAEGYIETDGNMHFRQEDAGRYMRFSTANTERMRIDSSGNLLVGTTSNSRGARLRVEGLETAHFTGYGNGYGIGLFMTPNPSASGGTATPVSFQNVSDATVGSITTTASATAYNTSSDYRLKEDVQPVANPVDRLKQLKPVNFAWKADGSRVDGFLAHEAQEVVPEAVTGSKDAVDKDGKPEYQGIDQSKLVPLLTAALQDAIAEIESLKARLDAANL